MLSLRIESAVKGMFMTGSQLRGLLALCLLLLAPITTLAEEKPREQVGEVLGEPVYRDQLSAKEGVALMDELHNLFSHPVMVQYRAAQREDIQPTEREVSTATTHFDSWHAARIQAQDHPIKERRKDIELALAQSGLAAEEKKKLESERSAIDAKLNPPGRRFAAWMVANWKFQRHLYKKYGGGRVLWQQAGLEAFDAMHEWLKQYEKKGDFMISDAALRDRFYAYWMTMDHGTFLHADKDFIEHEFLNPYWLRPFIGDSLKKNLEADKR